MGVDGLPLPHFTPGLVAPGPVGWSGPIVEVVVQVMALARGQLEEEVPRVVDEARLRGRARREQAGQRWSSSLKRR